MGGWLLVLTVSLGGFAPPEASADSISWGTKLAGETFYQSDGSVFDNTFQFQLGVFEEISPGSPFIPTEGNISLWNSHWRVFNEATETNGAYNVGANAVLLTEPLDSSGTSALGGSFVFFDEQPYVWAFNNKVGDATSEWALYTDASWVFPSSSADTNPVTHSFFLADSGTVAVFGGINDTSSDTGNRSSFPENFSIQTHSVPEPSVVLFLVVATGALSVARRR
ncbi:MAG: hypothetical protein KDN22_08105 [Verrucomicrobiae bacterium]|nr:hypothetical protein [Verrucomicrobiae bacterium]